MTLIKRPLFVLLLLLAVLLLIPVAVFPQVVAIIGDSTTASIGTEDAFPGAARLMSHANFIYVADANREIDSMYMWSWDGSGTLGLAAYKILDADTTMVGTEQTLDPGSSNHQLWGLDVSPNIELTAGDSLVICIGNQTAALGSGYYTLTAGTSYDAETGSLPDPFAPTATVNIAYIVYATVVHAVGTDSLIPTDSIPPDGWQNGITARVPTLVEAGSNTIKSTTDDDTAGVGMQNTSLTNIDSIEVHFRARRDGFGSGDSLRVDIIVGGTRAVGDTIQLGSFANYSKVFQDVPGGSGWTQAQVNGITIEIISMEVGGLDENQMDWLYVEVHETPAESAGSIIIIGD